jgi:hypothetical protein
MTSSMAEPDLGELGSELDSGASGPNLNRLDNEFDAMSRPKELLHPSLSSPVAEVGSQADEAPMPALATPRDEESKQQPWRRGLSKRASCPSCWSRRPSSAWPRLGVTLPRERRRSQGFGSLASPEFTMPDATI